MTGRLRAGALGGLAGGLAGVLCLALAYVAAPVLRIEFAVDPPRFVTGFHPAEYEQATGLTFAWTGRDAALRLPGLDRRVPWRAEIRLRGGRATAADNPVVRVLADGAPAGEVQSGDDFTTAAIDVPSSRARRRGLRLTMAASRTFRPEADPRELGVQVDRVILTPEGLAFVPPAALVGAGVSAAAMGLAFGLIGLGGRAAATAAVLVAALQAVALARGFAPLTAYPEAAARAALSIGCATASLVLAVERARSMALTGPARAAAALTAAVLLLKLLVFLHPEMPIGDALFQAHRFQQVLGGTYYFTSIAPGNYLFPYAPGLYVAAAPFAEFVRRETGDMALLRIVVACTDAAAAVVLYAGVVHAWRHPLTAACASAIYQLLPLTFLAASGGTLTSAFAQSIAVAVFVLFSVRWMGPRHPAALLLLAGAGVAAFLSHTSTFAILSAAFVLVPLIVAWRGGPTFRAPAAGIAAAGLVAVGVAVAVYYGHFLETYRTELARIGGETATAAPDAGGRSIGDRAQSVPRYLREYYGLAPLLLAVPGSLALRRRAGPDRLQLALAGWAVTCLLFLALGILTPVDMRYYVAALPAVAIVAASGATAWWEQGGGRRAAAAALVLWTAAAGAATWWSVLR